MNRRTFFRRMGATLGGVAVCGFTALVVGIPTLPKSEKEPYHDDQYYWRKIYVAVADQYRNDGGNYG